MVWVNGSVYFPSGVSVSVGGREEFFLRGFTLNDGQKEVEILESQCARRALEPMQSDRRTHAPSRLCVDRRDETRQTYAHKSQILIGQIFPLQKYMRLYTRFMAVTVPIAKIRTAHETLFFFFLGPLSVKILPFARNYETRCHEDKFVDVPGRRYIFTVRYLELRFNDLYAVSGACASATRMP